MDVLAKITAANKDATRIRDIYLQLRGSCGTSTRMQLLREAEQYADGLSRQLAHINDLAAGNLTQVSTLCALQELGAVMEKLMVQEREYRISAGGTDTGMQEVI